MPARAIKESSYLLLPAQVVAFVFSLAALKAVEAGDLNLGFAFVALRQVPDIRHAGPKPTENTKVQKERRLTHLEECVIILVFLQFTFSFTVIFVFSRASLVFYAACLESPEL
jgi:hypothetical protein